MTMTLDSLNCLVTLLSFSSICRFATSSWNSSFRSVYPGVWTPFQSWGHLSPSGRQHAAATTATDSKNDISDYELMIMYGGVEYRQDNATWLYNLETKSWQRYLNLSPSPPAQVFHTMVTLCGKLVVLFGGAGTTTERGEDSTRNTRACKNETWIFNMTQKKWNFLPTRSSVIPRCKHAAAAVISQPISQCSCKESMLVYGGVSKFSSLVKLSPEFLFDSWELRCVRDGSETSLPVFEWMPFRFKGNDEVHLQFPQAVSAFGKSTLILFGRNSENSWNLQSYNLTNSTWDLLWSGNKKTAPGHLLYKTGHEKGTPQGRFHLLISCCNPLWIFDLLTKRWYEPKMRQNGIRPQVREGTSSMAVIGSSILTFGGEMYFLPPMSTLWNLTLVSPEYLEWSVVRVQRPQLQYRALAIGGIVNGDKLVIFGGGVTMPDQVLRSISETWILDLLTLVWEKHVGKTVPSRAGAAGATLQGSHLIIYGGAYFDFSKNFILEMASLRADTWGYNYLERKWSPYKTDRNPGERALHTALPVSNNGSAMIVLGGASLLPEKQGLLIIPKLDIWMFTLNTSLVKPQGNWVRLHETGPHTYFAHAVVLLRGKVLVYGGTHSVFQISSSIISKVMRDEVLHTDVVSWSIDCEDTIWTFDLETKLWEEVNYTRHEGPGRRCFMSGALLGENMIIDGGCPGAKLNIHLITGIWDYQCMNESFKMGVWSYHIGKNTWTQLTAARDPHHLHFLPWVLQWQGIILEIGGISFGKRPDAWTGFTVYKPACPPGAYTPDFASTGCLLCPIGQYSSSSGSCCTHCPPGLSTPEAGSIDKTNCSVCDSSSCGHGQCRVTLPGPSSYCECDFGYTKNDEGRCSVATYYLAGTGFLAGILLLLLVVAVLLRLKRAEKSNKAALRDKDHELTELTNGWIVDPRELKLGGRLDKRSPGGFGDVYKADYREMTVAVKKLKQEIFEMERSEIEFEREMQVMRTIRHPNVVMFLGVGHFSDTGCPFIVMEYMSRGSLGTILKSYSIVLTTSQQIRFALDAAKGMRFLHSCRPARIHRDLKSGNLLVSERWIVKVTDFGSARLVKDEGVEQDAVRGYGRLTLDAPLLQPQYVLSTCVGTALWTAPELLQGENYSTAVDVYR